MISVRLSRFLEGYPVPFRKVTYLISPLKNGWGWKIYKQKSFYNRPFAGDMCWRGVGAPLNTSNRGIATSGWIAAGCKLGCRAPSHKTSGKRRFLKGIPDLNEQKGMKYLHIRLQVGETSLIQNLVFEREQKKTSLIQISSYPEV